MVLELLLPGADKAAIAHALTGTLCGVTGGTFKQLASA